MRFRHWFATLRDAPPLLSRVPILVRSFYDNLVVLMKQGDLRSLELFIGEFCFLWGMCRFIPVFWQPGTAPFTLQRALPSFLWASFVTALGLLIIIGAVQNRLSYRVWGCRVGMMLWIGILLLHVASGVFVAERFAICVYFVGWFSWLYARILREAMLLRVKEEGSADRSEGRDNPPDGLRGERRYFQDHRGQTSRT